MQQNQQNGWNLDDFQTAVATIKEQPEAGRLTFRTRFDWDAGFGGDARTEEIEQMGQVMPRRFTLRGDHPPQLLGHNTGPTAVETLLAALGSCIAGTYAAHATARGITIDDLEVEIEGDIDLNGFLQLAPTRPGLNGVKARVRVKSDADDATLRELCQITSRASPVYDSVSNPVMVDASVERVTS